MSSLAPDPWIEEHTVPHDVKVIQDCAIAVDASYYIQLFLNIQPYNEPLLPALGGLTGIHHHIEVDLNEWRDHRVTPLFIFDGQPVTGEDEVSTARGIKANEKTDRAWDLYFEARSQDAVTAFTNNNGAYRVQSLYPMLQSILKERGLHFLVTPYNAAAQMAYFELVDSDQVAGIMGSEELLLYPINDGIIRSINWEDGKLSMSFKKDMIKALNVNESMFIDALLMIGTSFLPQFPPLQDTTLYPRQKATIADAINVLRTADKSVGQACASFNDILQAQDPNWLDKYRKARMWVSHFIYITEDGQVLVHDYDKLTQDNHEYLGLQLPSELFHYLNTGLIGPRILSWITHCKISVLPTLAGVASEEYKKLVTDQLLPVKEMTLGLLIPRLNRGIQHRDVVLKVWWDDKFSYSFTNRSTTAHNNRASGWGLGEETVKARFPEKASGSIAYEISALKDDKFLEETHNKERIKDGLGPADAIVSLALWRFLHLKGYASDAHDLTKWGTALSTALGAFAPTVDKYPEIRGLNEAVLLAFELIRYGVLSAKHRHEELQGLAMNGTDAEKDNLLLISRCGALLKLRHQAMGYTGPLSKNLLFFHSLVSEVRDADRDLVEAVLASMFMYGQAKRERDDGWDIRQRLPFLNVPDVALGIAVKTLLDEVEVKESAEARADRLNNLPTKFFPCATHFVEDIGIAFAFFDAVHAGVKVLSEKELSTADKAAWDGARKYLDARR